MSDVTERPGGGPAPAATGGPGGIVFWAAALIGGATVVVALRELWAASSPTAEASILRFLLGAGIVHDLLWAPVVVAVAIATSRLPVRVRTPVRFGLAFTAVVLVVAWAPLRGYGRRSDNPSLLPHDYGTHVAWLLVAIWATVVAVVLVRVLGARRSAG